MVVAGREGLWGAVGGCGGGRAIGCGACYFRPADAQSDLYFDVQISESV